MFELDQAQQPSCTVRPPCLDQQSHHINTHMKLQKQLSLQATKLKIDELDWDDTVVEATGALFLNINLYKVLSSISFYIKNEKTYTLKERNSYF